MTLRQAQGHAEVIECMKKTLIVANWKSNMTEFEANEWFQKMSNIPQKEVIICPPFTLLRTTALAIKNRNLEFKIGAQDISYFDEGAYTGEINGKQIKEFADYVIVGHSERRQNFSENDEMLFKKVELAKKYNLIPIFCTQGKETKIPSGIDIVAYEPIDAIGTGHPETPENAEEVSYFFKNKYSIQNILYGGSVSVSNVGSFTQLSNIDGVLVGKESLDPMKFLEIIKNA